MSSTSQTLCSKSLIATAADAKRSINFAMSVLSSLSIDVLLDTSLLRVSLILDIKLFNASELTLSALPTPSKLAC
jgi:hypothetical protein